MFFFFSSRRRHTRLQGDWSSDVCSSDLDTLHWMPARSKTPATRATLSDRSNPNDGSPMTMSPRPACFTRPGPIMRSEEHTSELQSPCNLVCRLLLEKKKILGLPLMNTKF